MEHKVAKEIESHGYTLLDVRNGNTYFRKSQKNEVEVKKVRHKLESELKKLGFKESPSQYIDLIHPGESIEVTSWTIHLGDGDSYHHTIRTGKYDGSIER